MDENVRACVALASKSVLEESGSRETREDWVDVGLVFVAERIEISEECVRLERQCFGRLEPLCEIERCALSCLCSIY